MTKLNRKTLLSFVLIGISILLIIFFGIKASLIKPVKVTDPSAPGFDISAFSLGDYDQEQELKDAFLKIFPVGSKREDIDRFLIHTVGLCTTQTNTASQEVRSSFKYPPSPEWNSSNYFIDYGGHPDYSGPSQRAIRILYNGQSHTLEEIYIAYGGATPVSIILPPFRFWGCTHPSKKGVNNG